MIFKKKRKNYKKILTKYYFTSKSSTCNKFTI